MDSSRPNSLFCDNCINFKLSTLKKLKEQQEREQKIREEQEQIEYSQRMQRLEMEALQETRRSLKNNSLELAKQLEDQYNAKKKKPVIKEESNSISFNYSKELEDSRAKYRQELLQQINEKQRTKLEQQRFEREIEKKRLEEIEAEKERSMKELLAESLMQRETYRHNLAQQMNYKQSKKHEELYQKQVEKALLDEQVRKFNEEQRNLMLMTKRGGDQSLITRENKFLCCENSENLTECSNCRKILPLQVLSKFPS